MGDDLPTREAVAQWKAEIAKSESLPGYAVGLGLSACDAVLALLDRVERLEQALIAAEQFIHPEIDRGPASNGWKTTVELVESALAAPTPERTEK